MDEIDPEDRNDPSDQVSPVSLVKYFKRRITPGGYSCFSGICSYICQDKNEGKTSMGTSKCSQPAVRTTTVKQVSNLIIFEIFKADTLPLTWDPHVDQELDVLQEKYKLTGLIYHSQARAHYWSEVYVDSSNAHCVSPGWYAHDGLVNGVLKLETNPRWNIMEGISAWLFLKGLAQYKYTKIQNHRHVKHLKKRQQEHSHKQTHRHQETLL